MKTKATMRRVAYSMMIFCLAVTVKAQSYNDIVEMARRNVHLKAMRAACDAAKDDAATGLALADPEVELGYQLGYPHELVPNRTQIIVKQELDMATLSGAKKSVTQHTSQLLDAQYDAAEWQTVIDARQALAALTSCNIQVKELERRSLLAKQLSEAYQRALANGTATAIEANTSLVGWQTIETELLNAKTERDIARTQLEELCGTSIAFNDTLYQPIALPTDFEQWFVENSRVLPQLKTAAQGIELAKEKKKLTRMESLPSLSIGYSGELVRDNNYHGAVVGFTLPLWANKGKKRAAEAAIVQATEESISERARLHSEYKQQYLRAVQYRNAAEQCRATLAKCNNEPLLLNALSDSNISVIEYLTELSSSYDLIDKLHECEREAAQAAAIFFVHEP